MTLLSAADLAAAQVEILCGRCRQPLTNTESRKRRYGLECAEILGIVDPGSPRIRSHAGGEVPGQGDVFAGEE